MNSHMYNHENLDSCLRCTPLGGNIRCYFLAQSHKTLWDFHCAHPFTTRHVGKLISHKEKNLWSMLHWCQKINYFYFLHLERFSRSECSLPDKISEKLSNKLHEIKSGGQLRMHLQNCSLSFPVSLSVQSILHSWAWISSYIINS